MSARAHIALWQAVCCDLELRLGRELGSVLLGRARLLSEEGPRLVVAVTGAFALEQLRRHHSVLDALVQTRSEGRARLVFEPGTELPAAPGGPCSPDERGQDPGPEGKGEEGRAGLASQAPPSTNGASAPAEQAEPARRFEIEGFAPGPSNLQALRGVLEVLKAPGCAFNPLYIHGPSGAGKSHLLRGLFRALRDHRGAGAEESLAILEASGAPPRAPGLSAACLGAEQFFQHYARSAQDRCLRRFQERFRSLDVLILDDIHLLETKKKTQIELLNIVAGMVDTGRQVVLAASCPPAELPGMAPALVSRLQGGLVVALRAPDFVTRAAIARRVASRLGAKLPPETLDLAARSVRGGARAVIGAVNRLHHLQTSLRRPIRLQEVEDVLAELHGGPARRATPERILAVVAEYFDVDPASLTGKARGAAIRRARQIAMTLAVQYTRLAQSEVGRLFDGRGHSAVRSALAAVRRGLEGGNTILLQDIDRIQQRIEE